MEPLNSNFLVAETVDFSYPDDDGKTKQSIIREAWHPNQLPSYHTVNSESHVTYTWMKNGHTECSTTCGTGKKLVHINLCINIKAHHFSILLANSWDVGEWSECSRRCGPGTQHRQVICRQVTDVHASGTETSVTVTSELCGSSDMPVTQSTCQLKICSQWDIRSEWSPTSLRWTKHHKKWKGTEKKTEPTKCVPCGVGQRTREVVCVSNQGDVDDDQECNMNLKPDTIQNCDMGLCARSWFTSIWSQRCSAECGRGSRTRSVVCLMDLVTNLPLDSCEGERPPEVTSCDSGPCQNRLEWYTGPWSQVIHTHTQCGNGTQTRSVACIFNSDGQMEVVDQLKCSSLSKPITSQPCRLKPCDPLCSDKYHNCMVVVQARLCVYSYYRSVCCASCSRAQETHPNSFQNNHIHR
uniref:ADAMTS-like 7 n=1 Tax=Neolamprologus brichardi TaxID=32507 RepID=A0A3Q4MX61_NEOBR